jgi:hypothetical protein
MEEWFHDSNKKEEVRHSREQMQMFCGCYRDYFHDPQKQMGTKFLKCME